MIENLLVFIFSLFLVVKGATLATKYSAKLAENFHLSKYVVGFIIVAFISIIPETLVSMNSAIAGIPEFGLGTLFGSNVADLTLIFAILIIYAGRGIKIESRVLKNVRLYPFFLFLPLLFGLNGSYSRIEGVALVFTGSLFYYLALKNSVESTDRLRNEDGKYKNILWLVGAMAMLLVGSHFTVTSATDLAHALKISPILIAMLVVSLGTTMPELFYSLKSVKKKDDGLAIGDIMGSVLADATIVVGILAVISPFSFPAKIVYVTGAFMLVASLVLLNFMKSGRTISKKEGYMLLVFWLFYAVVEFFVSK
ncbi:MAG: sodium:calcium antiporter [Patescibacteria group bacterium]|nr:sodium:calcium antiporter [Patescibacteria group bacterium]